MTPCRHHYNTPARPRPEEGTGTRACPSRPTAAHLQLTCSSTVIPQPFRVAANDQAARRPASPTASNTLRQRDKSSMSVVFTGLDEDLRAPVVPVGPGGRFEHKPAHLGGTRWPSSTDPGARFEIILSAVSLSGPRSERQTHTGRRSGQRRHCPSHGLSTTIVA